LPTAQERDFQFRSKGLAIGCYEPETVDGSCESNRKEGFMEKVTELFVVVENRPGALGDLLGHLNKEKINIEAIGCFRILPRSQFQMSIAG
jgi:hypothetical protein